MTFNQSAKFLLSFNERGLPQIGIVQPNKIECEKYRPASTVQQLFKLAHTAGIEGDECGHETMALQTTGKLSAMAAARQGGENVNSPGIFHSSVHGEDD